jgi:hypothetical protein
LWDFETATQSERNRISHSILFLSGCGYLMVFFCEGASKTGSQKKITLTVGVYATTNGWGFLS